MNLGKSFHKAVEWNIIRLKFKKQKCKLHKKMTGKNLPVIRYQSDRFQLNIIMFAF